MKRKLSVLLALILFLLLFQVPVSGASKATGNMDWQWPLPGNSTITSCFGSYCGHNHIHNALDIKAEKDTKVYAAYEGTVIYTFTGCSHNYGKSNGVDPGGHSLGNYVLIEHTYLGTRYVSRYAHMTSVKVNVGDKVTQNTIVGTVGSTGDSSGYHLDFKIYEKDTDEPVDPLGSCFVPAPAGFNAAGSNSCCKNYVSAVRALNPSAATATVSKPASAANAASSGTYKLTYSKSYVYSKPSYGDSIVVILSAPCTVEALDSYVNSVGSQWLYIRSGNNEGWVSASDLTYVGPASSSSTAGTVNTANTAATENAANASTIVIPEDPSLGAESRISFSGMNSIGSLKLKKATSISGTVKSALPIASVKAQFVNASTGKVISSSTADKPYSTTYSLRGSRVDRSLKFGSLAVGSYKYQVVVTDTSGKTKTYTSSKFKIVK